ncbi:MFS transporter [Catellatospora sp. NPDC049609]|uniref:MFS transporter n=1 Tax=Catellatospora sp. NPDC049609 TaxID=3155505 RepID=UPI00341AEB4E
MQLMIILDGTIVTVALPAIQQELGFSPASLAWVVNAYLIAFAGLLLLAGRLGDLVGARRVFLAGLAVFTLASLVCGLAAGPELLIAGRFAQGVGAALASAVVLGMIVSLYPEPGAQARAMGVYSFVSAGGASIGLVAGGVLTENLGWAWAFLINVPIGAAALLLAVRLLPAQRGIGLGQGADVLGAVLVTLGLSTAVYAIVASAEPATTPRQTLVLGVVALVLLGGFVARQATAARPMLPLRIFRSAQLSGANVVVVLVFAAGFGFQFLNALYLQRVLEFSAMQTGLAFLPGPVTIGVVSLFLAARLVARLGTRTVLLAGLAVLAVGLLLLGRAPVGGSYPVDVLPVLVLMGLGMGLAIPAVIMLAMSGARPADAGLASGLNNTAQQAGAAVGLAVLATVAASHTATLLDGGADPVRALRDGYSLAFVVSAGFVLAGLAVALLIRPQQPSPAAEQAAEPVLAVH